MKKIKAFDPAKIEKLVQEIVKNFSPSAVILHGSAAKGEFVDKLSDIDMVIISPKFKNVDQKERFVRVLEITQKQALKVDGLGYTPEEFTRMIEKLNFFALDVVYYGIPLHNEDNIWDVIVDEFKKVKDKYRLKKTETGGWTYVDRQ